MLDPIACFMQAQDLVCINASIYVTAKYRKWECFAGQKFHVFCGFKAKCKSFPARSIVFSVLIQLCLSFTVKCK